MEKNHQRIDYLQILGDKNSFSRIELLESMNKCGLEIGEAVFKVRLQKLLNNGLIVRVGRNAYCVAGKQGLRAYQYNYSDMACNAAAHIKEKFPDLDFTISEYIQINEFVNKKINQNTVFVCIEGTAGEAVFDVLKGKYQGRLLFNPTLDIFQRYWCEDMIVIEKMVSEAPLGQREKWNTRLEKLLVDLMTDDILKKMFPKKECSGIYEKAFEKYAVDESCLFRYAKRRGADKKIRDFMKENTRIVLRTE